MFIPDFFGIVDEQIIETFPENLEHDSEDLMDDRYLLEVMSSATQVENRDIVLCSSALIP